MVMGNTASRRPKGQCGAVISEIDVPVTVANILNLVSSLVQSLWDCLNGLVMVISGFGYESGSTQL